MSEYNEEDYYNYCLSCGFNEDEAKEKIKEREILLNLYFKNQREPREITCSTYEKVKKRLDKEIKTIMDFDRR